MRPGQLVRLIEITRGPIVVNMGDQSYVILPTGTIGMYIRELSEQELAHFYWKCAGMVLIEQSLFAVRTINIESL